MVPRLAVSLLAALGLAALPGGAAGAPAAVPSPSNSVLPSTMSSCPDGTVLTQVLVRDIANNPILGATVALDFSDCAAFQACDPPCDGCGIDRPGHVVRLATNSTGLAFFDLRLGGACRGERVKVYADGLLLGSVPYAPIDQTGDLAIGDDDVAIVSGLLGTGETSADFNGDHVVDATDLAIVRSHLGSVCIGAVPARARTWGALKTIFR
jgi:hypothetical protein